MWIILYVKYHKIRKEFNINQLFNSLSGYTKVTSGLQYQLIYRDASLHSA